MILLYRMWMKNMRYLDISNQKFHRLTATRVSNKRGKDGSVYWTCKCDCGKITEVRSDALRNGNIKSCGCLLRVDLTGKKFGMLTVIQDAGIRDSHSQVKWLCKCDCGGTSTPTTVRLTSGMTKSCGCLRRKTGTKHHSFTGVGTLSGNFWNRVLNGAKVRKIAVKISIKSAWNKLQKQYEKCALTGVPISFHDNTASLDRINSDKPYQRGNIQWVHKRINLMKGTLSNAEFLEWCKKVVDCGMSGCN